MKHVYDFDRFTLEVREKRLFSAGEEVDLSFDDVSLLLALVERRPRVVSRDSLLKLLSQDPNEPPDDNLLAKHVQIVREALGDSARRPRFIKTVYGRGYQFIAEVIERGKARSIAILPFITLGVVGEGNYLGLGIADAVATRLTKLQELRVVPPNLVLSPTQAARDSYSLAEEMGVEWLLTGSIRKWNDRLRVIAQLAVVKSRRQIWSQKFDGRPVEVFDIEDMIAEQVAQQMELLLSDEDKRLLAQRVTENSDAYEDYLMGRMYWYQRELKALRKGLDCFERAVRKDPGFTLAYVGIANSYIILGSFGSEEIPPKEAMPRAEEAARRALTLDNNSAEAYASIASVEALFHWRWSRAEEAFRRSLSLNPRQFMTRCWYAQCLTAAGQFERALLEVNQARKIKPTSLIVNATASRLLYHAGRYDEAVEQARKTVNMEKNFFLAHTFLALSYKAKGEFSLAIEELEIANRLSEDNPATLGELGHTYACSGEHERANSILRDLLSLRQQRYVSPYTIAKIYLGLRQFDATFDYLEEAYACRTAWLIFLTSDPIFETVKSDRRFADLIRRINFQDS